MPDRPIVWADQPLDAYLTLSDDGAACRFAHPPSEGSCLLSSGPVGDAAAVRQSAVLERLRALAADPYSDAAYDPTWHWWTAEYGAGTGFLTFVIARDDHLVVIRLIDAS